MSTDPIDQIKEVLLLKHELLVKKEKIINELRRELEDLRSQFNEIYNFNSLPIVIIDNKGFIQSINFPCSLLLDHDRIQLINTNFLYLINTFHQHSFKQCIQAVLERRLKQECEIEILYRGNARKQVIIECYYIKSNYIQLVIKDITYIRQLESERLQLKHSQEIYSNILQNVSDAMATLDKDFYFIIINTAFIQFFSKIFSKKIQKGMNFFSVIADFIEYKHTLIQACEQALQGKSSSIIIKNLTEIYEANFCFELNFSSIYNPNSECQEIIIFVKDLTEVYLKKQLKIKKQSQLVDAMRLNTMEGMASALAHELNQPLTSIFLYGQTALLQLKENNKEAIPHILNKIISQTKHATEVMKRLKCFFNQEFFSLEETSINAIIQESIEFISVHDNFS